MSLRKPTRATHRVHCLGTGDGWPCAERHHSSYLFELAGACALIDCGESVCRSLAARKFDWHRLDAIVLSHTHADHLGGLFMLLQGLWLEGRTRALTLHLPGHAIEPLQRMLRHGYLFDELLRFKLRFVPLRAERSFKIGGVKFTPFPTSHLDRLRRKFPKVGPVRFEAFSFLLESAGRRIVHSADLGAPADLLPLLRKPVDLLVCELAHFEADELFACLRDHTIRQVAFVHVARRFRARLSKVKRHAKKSLPGVVCVFPEDGEVLTV